MSARGTPIRRLMFGSLFGVVFKAGGVILAFASQVILARSLGADAFGVYVTVIAWALVLSLLGGFGLPLCAVRFLSVYAERQQWPEYRAFLRHAAGLTVLSSVAIGALTLLTFSLVPTLRPILPATLAGVPLILLLSASALASAIFLAAQMPLRADGLANLSRPMLVGALVGGTVLLGVEMGVELALALTVVAGLATLLLQLAVLWRVIAPHWRGAASAIDRSTWISSGVAVLFTTATSALLVKLDTIILSALISPAVAGPYDVAARLAMTVGMASSSVNALLSPMSAQMLARGDNKGLQRILTHGTLLSSLLTGMFGCGLIFFAHPVLTLFGASFVTAQDALLVLVVGQVAVAICGPAGGVLAMAGHNRPLVLTMVFAVALNLVLLFVLTPQYGRLGAALATALTLSVTGIVLSVITRRLLHVDTTLLAGLVWLLRAQRERRGLAMWRRRDRL